MTAFVEIAKSAFALLESDFGFHILGENGKSERTTITYINTDSGVGVRILNEARDGFVFVLIGRLVEGKLVNNPQPITSPSDVNIFNFNDYLTGDLKIRQAYDHEQNTRYCDEDNGLQFLVEDFAAKLREHGSHILSGDLSMLNAMGEIIMRRERGERI